MTEKPVKYFIGKLKERNGEQEYTHTVRFMTNGDPNEYLDNVASRFYDAEGADEDGAYWHLQGTVLVAADVCREIPQEFYAQCHEFGAVEAA